MKWQKDHTGVNPDDNDNNKDFQRPFIQASVMIETMANCILNDKQVLKSKF